METFQPADLILNARYSGQPDQAGPDHDAGRLPHCGQRLGPVRQVGPVFIKTL